MADSSDLSAMRLHELDLLTRDEVWVTREGVKIPVQQMEDGHLVNAVRFLEEKLTEYDDCDEEAHFRKFGLDDVRDDIEESLSLLKDEQERRELLKPKRGLGRMFGDR